MKTQLGQCRRRREFWLIAVARIIIATDGDSPNISTTRFTGQAEYRPGCARFQGPLALSNLYALAGVTVGRGNVLPANLPTGEFLAILNINIYEKVVGCDMNFPIIHASAAGLDKKFGHVAQSPHLLIIGRSR